MNINPLKRTAETFVNISCCASPFNTKRNFQSVHTVYSRVSCDLHQALLAGLPARLCTPATPPATGALLKLPFHVDAIRTLTPVTDHSPFTVITTMYGFHHCRTIRAFEVEHTLISEFSALNKRLFLKYICVKHT